MVDAPALGIDIGGTNLRVACVDAEGCVTEHATESVRRDPTAVLDRLLGLCRDRAASTVVGIGIGIPGRVDARRRAVLSGGYVDLSGLHLAERLEDATGRPVVIDNDGNMALRAEMMLGAARGVANVAMLTIGTGIGGALALDGSVVHGGGTAGQLGHITVDPDGPPCLCGRLGCVETTSSGTALGRLLAVEMPAGTRVDDLIRQAQAGDMAAERVIVRWIGPLRAAIDSIVATVSPERVLLGGGLGAAATACLAWAPALSPWYRCEVRAAALGDDAGVIGAGLAALAAERLPRGSFTTTTSA